MPRYGLKGLKGLNVPRRDWQGIGENFFHFAIARGAARGLTPLAMNKEHRPIPLPVEPFTTGELACASFALGLFIALVITAALS